MLQSSEIVLVLPSGADSQAVYSIWLVQGHSFMITHFPSLKIISCYVLCLHKHCMLLAWCMADQDSIIELMLSCILTLSNLNMELIALHSLEQRGINMHANCGIFCIFHYKRRKGHKQHWRYHWNINSWIKMLLDLYPSLILYV